LIEVRVFGAEPPCVKCKQSEQEAFREVRDQIEGKIQEWVAEEPTR